MAVDIDQYRQQTLRLQALGQRLQNRKLMRIGEVVDEDGDLMGGVRREAAGKQVGRIVQGLRRPKHLLPACVRNGRTGRERTDDGPFRHAGGFRHLFRRRPFAHDCLLLNGMNIPQKIKMEWMLDFCRQ